MLAPEIIPFKTSLRAESTTGPGCATELGDLVASDVGNEAVADRRVDRILKNSLAIFASPQADAFSLEPIIGYRPQRFWRSLNSLGSGIAWRVGFKFGSGFIGGTTSLRQ